LPCCSKEQIKNLTEKVDYFELNVKFIEDGTGAEQKASASSSLVDKEWSSLLCFVQKSEYR
jgi:hypothetical protein